MIFLREQSSAATYGDIGAERRDVVETTSYATYRGSGTGGDCHRQCLRSHGVGSQDPVREWVSEGKGR